MFRHVEQAVHDFIRNGVVREGRYCCCDVLEQRTLHLALAVFVLSEGCWCTPCVLWCHTEYYYNSASVPYGAVLLQFHIDRLPSSTARRDKRYNALAAHSKQCSIP